MEAVREKSKSKQKRKKVKEAKKPEEINNEEQSTSSVSVVRSLSQECDEKSELLSADKEETFEKTLPELTITKLDTIEPLSEQNVIKEQIKQDTNSYEKVLNANRAIVKSLKNEKVVLPQVKPKEIIQQAIRPYTELQLAALYTNIELKSVEQFSIQFIEAELKGFASKRHQLYGLLENYLQARNKITGNTLEFDQLRHEYKEVVGQIWTIETATVTRQKQCSDGVSLIASQNYSKAIYHKAVFQTIDRLLSSVRKVTTETHVLFSYLAEVSKLQIELYLQTLTTNCLSATQLQKNSPVSLVEQDVPLHLVPIFNDLRLCISVLFLFQRRIIRDVQFIKESRNWLSQLVAILLRVANWQDHLFILNHVLRCPAGVGSWAAKFIQMPLSDRLQESPFSSYKINHIVAVIAVILMPVEKREQFLEQLLQPADNAEEALWVIVDSEGEEDDESSGTALRENDLVQLLNQIPLDDLFRSVLLIQRQNGKDYYDASQITEHHILRFLSFATTIINILQSGLETYCHERYHQFSKRLCRFVRHVVQYSTDLWEQFKKNENLNDVAMLQRLQVEYDAFLLRTANCLYKSQKSGAWQFLAALPYHLVSINTLWKIFYLLHGDNLTNLLVINDYSRKLWDETFRANFEIKLSTLDDAESCYLLNAFSNMILARNDQDIDFIEVTTMDLLQIGFVSEATQDNCSKNVRILLTHITSRYPHFLSNILKCIKTQFSQIGSLSLYLFEDLPLSIWKPTDADMEIITFWLTQYSITTDESRLTRMILSRLNWGLTDENCLFLPYSFHVKIALLLAQVVEQDSGYLQWAWQTSLRLKLHYNDKAFYDLSKIPDLLNISVVNKGVRDKSPFACFLAILMTSHGHLVPMVCSHGLILIENLLINQKHDAVLFSLYLIVPLFLNCQESLINCEKFQNILMQLINADRTYINMAKSLVITQNEVVKQFGHMINYQIENFQFYNLDSPRYLVRIWMSSLVSIPNWNRDAGVLYLLDVVIKAAFFHVEALDSVVGVLRDLLQCATPQENNLSISSLFKWASSSNSPQGTLLTANSLPCCVWLAYVLIGLEFDEREKQTGLWKEVLTQLKYQKGKVNIDAAIKKAASIVKVSSFTSASLCIYRWAQQALDTSIDHPLLPLLWQKFFTLYLARVPVSNSVDRGCLGEKFFTGIINLGFFKRLKKRLQETVEFYVKKTENVEEECDSGDQNHRKRFYENCLRIFRAYSLWLEEPRLQEANLYLPSLPPQYEPQLLSLIIQGNMTPWLEHVDYETVKLEQQLSSKTWKTLIYREKSKANQPLLIQLNKESLDPVERILNRIKLYDSPKPPPDIVKSAPIVPPIRLNAMTSLINELKLQFGTLEQFAHNHSLLVSEYKELDSTYKELVPQQYRSVLCKVSKRVACKGQNNFACAGAAVIQLEYKEAKINESVDHQIQVNRSNYEFLVGKSLQAPAQNLCTAAVSIQKTIEILAVEVKAKNLSPESGVELFYQLFSMINEDINAYPPTKHFYNYCLEQLGENFICGIEYETPRLLNKILEEHAQIDLLVPYFSPINVGTTNFLHMYSVICDDVGRRYSLILSLLSKFDISNWLVNKQPKVSQRVQFIQLVVKGLAVLNFEPPAESLALHEIYRGHLLAIFEYQFPEHYIDVLTSLLNVSNGSGEVDSVSLQVWLDVLNSTSRPTKLKLGGSARDQLRSYAHQQRKLSYQELITATSLLAKFFANERLQYGLYGLYPKFRNYVEVLILLCGLMGHGLIASSLSTHQDLLGDKLCEKLWPVLMEMFAPWIVPYWMQNIKDNMATWMQQLTDDRSVLLPWIPADGPFAQRAMNMLFECVQFIIQIIPGSNCILSFVWQWYVINFAHPMVKEHILNVVHASFLALPWHNFWPTVSDLEFMLKVIEQYLPECHVFLGHIFVEIPWINWVNRLSQANKPLIVRVHQCLLHLLVKLSNEPNIRTNCCDKIRALLVQAESFDWNLLEPIMYQQVLDWYVMSCDPLVLCSTDPLQLDFRVLHFLQVVGHYDTAVEGEVSTSLFQKRHIYVRSYVKLISVVTSKHKNLIAGKSSTLTAIISSNLTHLDSIVKSEAELTILLEEIFGLLNIEMVKQTSIKCFEWFSSKSADSILLRAVLKTLGPITDSQVAGNLYEIAVQSYFCNGTQATSVEPSWEKLAQLTKFFTPRQTELEQSLVIQGNLLTLNVCLYQKVHSLHNFTHMDTILQWLNDIKVNPNVEDKLIPLWSQLLFVTEQNCVSNKAAVASTLHKFSQLLLQLCVEKGIGGWGKGLLGALGIVKQDVLSLRFRFLCRALAGYILAQLPDSKGEQQTIRCCPNAPGTVGQPGGNTECVKVLLGLDFGQSQGEIKTCASLALKLIQDSNNSLHNSRKFLALLVTQLYTKPYLKDIDK